MGARASEKRGYSVRTNYWLPSQPVYQKQKIIGWRVRQSINSKAGIPPLSANSLENCRAGWRWAQSPTPFLLICGPGRGQPHHPGDCFLWPTGPADCPRAWRPGYRIVRMDIVTTGTPVRPMALQRMAVSMEAADSVIPRYWTVGTSGARRNQRDHRIETELKRNAG